MTSNCLKIDFWGEGYGETIFLEFPNGKIGIIDCGNQIFIDWFSVYIKEKNISNIAFIVWTHPHADHTSHFPALLKLCKNKNIIIDYFMRFGILQFTAISKIIEELHLEEVTPKIIEDLQDFGEEIIANQFKPSVLKETLDSVEELIKDKIILNYCETLKYGDSLFSLNDLDEGIELFCLAPTQENIKEYYERAKKLKFNSESVDDFCLYSKIHNIISVALCLKYGETSVILGGDVLNNTWQSILNETRHQHYSHNPLKLIKVPHHGSNTAYLKEIWDKWGNDIYSVICPLVRYPLPKIADLDNFLEHTKKIFILKDKYMCTLLDYICQKTIGSKYNPITESKEATNHISFKISNDGQIKQEWL